MFNFVLAWIFRQSARLSAWMTLHRWPIQLIGGAIALSLGFWGWSLKNPVGGWSDYFNNFFRTLQLITLHFPTEFDGAIPWQLQVARLMVPFVAVLASFHVLVGAVTRPLRLALLTHTRDHFIVCGDAQMTEAALLTLAARARRIVIVAATFDTSRRDMLEGFGLTVVQADPRELGTLQGLNLKDASALFLSSRDDLENLNLAMIALPAAKDRSANMPPLVLGVLVDREDLASELDAALDSIARSQRVRYHRLCLDRESLRIDLARFAPVFAKQDRSGASHVLIIGLSGRWEQIVSQLLISTQDCPVQKSILSFVLNADDAAKLAAWRSRRPDLDLVARFETLSANTQNMPSDEEAPAWRERCGVPHLAVVLRDDVDAIATALALRRPGNALGTDTTPILVRQSREDHLLAALGTTSVRDRDLTRMVAFGGVIRAESIERVLDRKGDDVAIALHAYYLDAVKNLPPGSPTTLAAWDELTENLRDANRASADHAPILFASAGFEIVEKSRGNASAHLDADELEQLARVEHRRWIADRIDRGWRSGPERNDSRLLHPSIRDYELLSENEREKDRSAVRALVEILGKTGKVLVRGELAPSPSCAELAATFGPERDVLGTDIAG